MSSTIQNRREFIRNIALTSSVVALAASPWLSVFGKENPTGKGASDQVRLAIIGTGSRAGELIRNMLPFLDEKNVKIVALCDTFQLHLEQTLVLLKEKAIAPAIYSDYRMMIEKEQLDGVIIATPLHEHARITVDCLQHGVHVFCEKAMARTLAETKLMYDTHLSSNRILQIGHQRLFNPVYLEGMQRIHNGELGVIGQIRAYWHRNNDWRRPLPGNDKNLERQINWRLYNEYSAGLLTELLSHQIQVANWALQKTPVSVMGTGSIRYWKDGREVPDNIALIYSYDDGTQFIYDSMISNKKYGLEEQIMGHLGTIEFEVNRQYDENPPSAPGIQQLINDIEKGVFNNLSIGNSSWVPEIASKYKGETIVDNSKSSDTGLQLEAYVEFIRKGSAPEQVTKEGYNAGIWTLLAETAIITGEKQTMPGEFII